MSIAQSNLQPDSASSVQDEQEATNRGVAQATGVLALGNVSSRVFGLLREIVLTNLFGASAAMDAFVVATVVPKNLYDLLIGGHVNGAIIPVLSKIAAKENRDELWRLVSVLVSMITVVLAALVLLLELAAPAIVSIFGGGFDLYTQALAVDLLRLTTPALIFMGLFAVLSGTLYALRVFTWPAFGTTVFNATIVLISIAFVPAADVQVQLDGLYPRWLLVRDNHAITIVALGWLLGSVAYMLLQLPGLRDARIRFTFNWRHPAIRQIGLLYLPVMFSLVIDTLVIRLFSYNLASQTGEGSISYMNWATTLIQFPQGLVTIAISIAILPTLSRQAALITSAGADAANPNRGAFKDTLGLGMRLAITLILPATVGLFVLATPIVDLLFGNGAFTRGDVYTTAYVLRLYLIGLPFAALDLLLVYAFYARQDTLTPALIGVLSLAVYMGVTLLLIPGFGLFSLMIADSVKHVVHATLSAYVLHRRMEGFGQQRFLLTAFKTGIAATVMGVFAYGLLLVSRDLIGITSVLRELLLVMVTAGLSASVFAVLAYLLRLEEWRWLAGIVRQRLTANRR